MLVIRSVALLVALQSCREVAQVSRHAVTVGQHSSQERAGIRITDGRCTPQDLDLRGAEHTERQLSARLGRCEK